MGKMKKYFFTAQVGEICVKGSCRETETLGKIQCFKKLPKQKVQIEQWGKREAGLVHFWTNIP